MTWNRFLVLALIVTFAVPALILVLALDSSADAKKTSAFWAGICIVSGLVMDVTAVIGGLVSNRDI